MLLSLFLACTCEPDALDSANTGLPDIPARVHLADGAIRDDHGRALVLRAVNVSNGSKDPSTGYYGLSTAEDMQTLASWGFNAVRLLVFWEAIEPEEGVIDTDYLNGVEERVRWATEAGLYVVLDMHQDVYGRGFGFNGAPIWTCDQALYDSFEPPEGSWALSYLTEEVRTCYDRWWASDTLQQHDAAAWRAVAERIADQPMVVGFDLMNEPWPASGDADAFSTSTLQRFYTDVAGAIAEVAPDRLVFIEPITMAQYGVIDPGLSAIDGVETVYAPHYYHPGVHEGQTYDGDPSPIDTAFDAYDEQAAAMNSAWWLGEWGGPPSDTGIAEYLGDVDARLAQRAVGSALWSFDKGGGFSIMDEDGALRSDIAQALQHPQVLAYGGDAGGATWDGATLHFTVLERPGVSAPSVVWVGDTSVTVQGAQSWTTDTRPGCIRVEGVGEISVSPNR